MQTRRRETSTAKKWENPACTELGFITRDEKSKRVGRGGRGKREKGRGGKLMPNIDSVCSSKLQSCVAA